MDTETQDTPHVEATINDNLEEGDEGYQKVGNKVVVAWCHNTDTAGEFTYSMVDMIRYDAIYGSQHTVHPEGGFINISTGPRIAEARNQVIDRFIEAHPSADWLLFLDADMTFEAALLEQLMEVGSWPERPVVGALCFMGGRSNRTAPTIWREIEIERNEQNQKWAAIAVVYDYPKNALLRVAATGGACILIHRNVLKRMKAMFGTLPTGAPNMYPWFADGLLGPGGQPLGEDTAFCVRARMAGCDVYVHTGIKTGHVKTFEVTESYYEGERQAMAELEAQGVVDFTNAPDASTPTKEPQEKPPAMNRAARRAAARKAQS